MCLYSVSMCALGCAEACDQEAVTDTLQQLSHGRQSTAPHVFYVCLCLPPTVSVTDTHGCFGVEVTKCPTPSALEA